jgi:hypothetical protein
MRRLLLPLLALALHLPAADRPNVVLIFADDLGWKDTGFGGSDFHETPRLDQLAREGLTFTSGYAAAGNCAPSRPAACPTAQICTWLWAGSFEGARGCVFQPQQHWLKTDATLPADGPKPG